MSLDLPDVVGPYPEAVTAAEVHVHAEVEHLAPRLLTTLRALAGGALRVVDELPPDALFLFDHAPLPVRTAEGGALIRFLSSARGGAPYPIPEAWRGGPTAPVPLLMGRGSLVCAGGRLLVSEAVLEQNQRSPDDVDREVLRALGFRPRAPEVVKALLAEGLGRPRRDFVFLPLMPGDAAAQVTSWLLPLGDVLVVPEIGQEAFEVIGLVHEVALGRLVQTFLDVRAAELQRRGFCVERLPMMPPTHLVRAPHREESWVGACSSPTSAVLLDIEGRRTALLPRASAAGFPDGYRAVLTRALEVWRARFTRAGFDVVFIDDGEVKERGGSLRRLVATFPSPRDAPRG